MFTAHIRIHIPGIILIVQEYLDISENNNIIETRKVPPVCAYERNSRLREDTSEFRELRIPHLLWWLDLLEFTCIKQAHSP